MNRFLLSLISIFVFAQNLLAVETLFTMTAMNSYNVKDNKIVTIDYDQNKKVLFFAYDVGLKTKTTIPIYGTAAPYYLITGFNGKEVVYVNFNTTNKFYIDYYNLETQTSSRLVNDPAYKESINLSSDKAVWIDYRNIGTSKTNSEVYLLDMATKIQSRITNDSFYQAKAVVDGNYIVWVEYRNATYGNIVLYNVETGQAKVIDAVNAHQDNPKIMNNYVVWEDYRNAATDPKNVDVYMYDIVQNQVKNIVVKSGFQGNPYIYENSVVYDDYKDNNRDSDISMYDISSGESTVLTSSTAFETMAHIDQRLVTWIKVDNNIISLVGETLAETFVSGNKIKIALEYEVLHAYPNPFNPAVNFEFNLAENVLDFSIYNINGERVHSFDVSGLDRGHHTLRWQPGTLPTGVYYAQMLTPKQILRNRITFIK